MTWREGSGGGNPGTGGAAGRSFDAGASRWPEPMRRLVEELGRNRLGKMTLAPAQMDLLVWLARMLDARDYLEIGSFIGLNVLSMALRGPQDLRIFALDVSVTHMDVARRHWRMAGVDGRIEPVLQSALLTLRQWRDAGVRERFDMILIDADKEPTPLYFELSLPLLRPSGIMVVDNVHLGGRVFETERDDLPPSVAVMARFLEKTMADPALDATVMPLGDGMLLVRPAKAGGEPRPPSGSTTG